LSDRVQWTRWIHEMRASFRTSSIASLLYYCLRWMITSQEHSSIQECISLFPNLDYVQGLRNEWSLQYTFLFLSSPTTTTTTIKKRVPLQVQTTQLCRFVDHLTCNQLLSLFFRWIQACSPFQTVLSLSSCPSSRFLIL
jgi:hypothetical protein